MMKVIDGKELAASIRENVKSRVEKLSETPGLAIILVGNDPASHVYVNLKQKACEEVGIHFEKFLYEEDIPTETILEKINELNNRKEINGVLVQLPLPNQDEDIVIKAIDPKKDVDGFHPDNRAYLKDHKPCLAPATALGILKLIDATEQKLSGMHAAVIGSKLFSEPVRILLTDRGVETDRLDPSSLSLVEDASKYDILITVVGRPGLITSDMIKNGAIIIDVGTTRIEDKIVGDVSPEVMEQKNGWITPVPGGVGPMTVSMLLVNVLKAYQFSRMK